jgi:hypothetical protein
MQNALKNVEAKLIPGRVLAPVGWSSNLGQLNRKKNVSIIWRIRICKLSLSLENGSSEQGTGQEPGEMR